MNDHILMLKDALPALYPIIVVLSLIVFYVYVKGVISKIKEHHFGPVFRMRLDIAIGFGFGIAPAAAWWGLAWYAEALDHPQLVFWLYSHAEYSAWMTRPAQIIAALLHIAAAMSGQFVIRAITISILFIILSVMFV